MTHLLWRAYWTLFQFDPMLFRGQLAPLYRKVRNQPLRATPAPVGAEQRTLSAIDHACIWYWKEVRCLQRSAATVFLLRKSGVAAQLVLGAQQIPFRAHAWVEVDGRIVNDKPYLQDIYSVLDRC
jgi:hypothetical protein